MVRALLPASKSLVNQYRLVRLVLGHDLNNYYMYESKPYLITQIFCSITQKALLQSICAAAGLKKSDHSFTAECHCLVCRIAVTLAVASTSAVCSSKHLHWSPLYLDTFQNVKS